MTRLCPTCSSPLPQQTRSRFCPRCSLRGALELADEESIPPVEPGRIIGNYELSEMLGRGGMGVVYRARQRNLGRDVALKVLVAGEFADEATRRRFQSEAAAVARLRHPHIVAIHEIGEHEGQPFFSMELIEGRTFADLVREGPLPPLTAARLLKPIVEAIQFAHEQGILHRDLKPSNLLLDAFGHPRVSDFGLARRLDSDERFTLTGEVLGSPSYLAPEQALGNRDAEGTASDVYSLGAILYHMLTGRPPFLGESPQAILRQVIESEPLSPRKLNPTVPVDLETICLKCVEKDPVRRYVSAQGLAEELDRFLKHEPVRARPVGLAGRTWRWSIRHPAKAGLILALATTLSTLAIVPTLAYLRVSRAEKATLHQLRETLLPQARALRLGGQPGQQRDGWNALVEAARLSKNSADTNFLSRLQREAIANLALDDAWIERATNVPTNSDPTLLRFDARQEIFASGSFTGPIRIVRTANGKQLHEHALTNQTLQHVVDFSSDGRFLATRHKEQIAIRDLTSGDLITSQNSKLNEFSFRADSKAIAFLRTNGVAIFELPTGDKISEWSTDNLDGNTIAFAPNNNWLAVGFSDGHGVEIREANSGQVQHRLRMPVVVSSLAWSKDNRWLAAGGVNGSVRLWDFNNISNDNFETVAEESANPPTWFFETQGTFIQALAFSPDGHWLASAGNDEAIRLFDVPAGRAGLSFVGEAYRLDFSPDSSRFGPVWQSGQCRWIHVVTSGVFRSARFQSTGSNPALAINADGSRIVAATPEELLLFPSNLVGAPEKIPFANSRTAHFANDGALLAFSFREGARWRLVESTNHVAFGARETFLPDTGGGEVVSISADGRTIALADYLRGFVNVHRDGKLLHQLLHPRAACVALSPDGQQLVSTSLDLGETHLWNVETGKQLATWPDEGGNRVRFSLNGQWLAQFGPLCVVRETTTWQARPLLTNLPPNSSTADALFSPDGKQLAVIMSDREVYLLNVPDFTTAAVLEAPSAARLHRLAWNETGEKLAVLAAQNEIQTWDLRELRAGMRRLVP